MVEVKKQTAAIPRATEAEIESTHPTRQPASHRYLGKTHTLGTAYNTSKSFQTSGSSYGVAAVVLRNSN